jgi:hypothetical protein
MSYIDQEGKAKIAAALKEFMPKDWKYSLAIRDHSQIVLTIQQAPVDLIKLAVQTGYHSLDKHVQLGPQRLDSDFKDTEVAELFAKIKKALYGADYFDHSDSMTDYFHCAYYVAVNLGKWNKAFVNTAAA